MQNLLPEQQEALVQPESVSCLGWHLPELQGEASIRLIGKRLDLYSSADEMAGCDLQGWRVYQSADLTAGIAYLQDQEEGLQEQNVESKWLEIVRCFESES